MKCVAKYYPHGMWLLKCHLIPGAENKNRSKVSTEGTEISAYACSKVKMKTLER